MSRQFIRFAGAALLFTMVAAARAQEGTYPPESGDPFPAENGAAHRQADQPFKLSVTTRAVVLDVVVTDRKGRLVNRPDLKRDDFTILEDGKPQRIRSFEGPQAHVMPKGSEAIVHSAADLRKIGDAPVTILVIDELNSRFEDMSFARRQMVEYLQKQPAVLPTPTVLMVAMNTTFQQMHDYTQDRDALIQVIQHHMPEYPWRMMNSGKGGPGAAERMAQVLAALQQIAQSSTGTPGRKNLVWAGSGFPSSDLSLLDNKTADTIEAAVKRVTNALLAARVTMYSINPAPGTTTTLEVDTPEDAATSQDENMNDPFGTGKASFETLATSTGGKAFRGRNDINNEIGEGISAGMTYYTLSYSPSNNSNDAAKYRKIHIVLKDPNLRAVTRDGYYPEKPAATNAAIATDNSKSAARQARANLQLDLSGALTSTISYNGLAVRAVPIGAGLYRVAVDDAGLTWTPDASGADHAEATVAAGWYDGKGKLISHIAREETAARQSDHTGAVFQLPVVLPANAVRLRIVARDATSGRMGTVDITPTH